MIANDIFNQEFSSILASLESRRKNYLTYFYLGVAIAIIILYGVIFLSAQIAAQLFELSNLVTQVDAGDTISIILMGFFAAATLILVPIFKYRGTNKSAAVATFRFHRFSLKDEAYSKIFKLFGPFEFAPRGGLSFLDIRRSSLFNQDQLYIPEDYVVGELNGVTIKFCEANMVKVHQRRRVSVFKGLLIVFDISEIKVKLRGDFKGRTAIIYDAQKNDVAIASHYDRMERFPLPKKFESFLEGYTTDVSEAQSIITADLLESIHTIASKLGGLGQQVSHWDDRLAHAVAEIYEYSKNKFLSMYGRSRLPSEVAYDEQNETGLDITKADPISEENSSLNKSFELEFYDDKFILTVPCKFDLFETNSIFEPALRSEDADLVYSIMKTLETVTQHLSERLV